MTTEAKQTIRRAAQQRMLRQLGDIPPDPRCDLQAALHSVRYSSTLNRVQSLLQPRAQRQNGLPVECVETGQSWESVSAAARGLRTSYFAVYQAALWGYRVKGKRIKWKAVSNER